MHVGNSPAAQNLVAAVGGRGPRHPSHHRAEALQDFPGARIAQLAKPVGEGIGTGRSRQFVEKAFDSEDIADLAWRSEVGRAQRCRRLPSDIGAHVRDLVRRIGIEREQARKQAAAVIESSGAGGEQGYVRMVRRVRRCDRDRFPRRNVAVGRVTGVARTGDAAAVLAQAPRVIRPQG